MLVSASKDTYLKASVCVLRLLVCLPLSMFAVELLSQYKGACFSTKPPACCVIVLIQYDVWSS